MQTTIHQSFADMLKSFLSLSHSLNLPTSSLFGTDGIRGKAGDLLTAPLALQVGFWAGHVLRGSAPAGSPVIIGQDSRNSSDMLATAIASGLTAAGLDVWHLGLCPTPCVAHLTRTTEAVGGIMISASHNPPEDNGIKFFNKEGVKLNADSARQIEQGLRGKTQEFSQRVDPIQRWGKHYYRELLVADYMKALREGIPTQISLQGLKIVLDLAWGAAVQVAPSLFRQLGAEVICLHDRADGDRINVDCGSTHLAQLQAAVAAHQADMGFAFDGDADRTLAVDSQGRVVDGDYILYFWGQYLHDRHKLPQDLIVATVMANLGFERAWQDRGGKLVRTAVGDQHVQAAMWETGAMLGGEQSGHILCHHHSYSGDGVQTAIHLASLVQQLGISLSDLVDQSFKPYPQLLKNVRVEDRDRRCHWQECDPLVAKIQEAEAAMGDRGRILVRASGTEPLIRVMVEAEEMDLAQNWTDVLVRSVQYHLT